MQRLKPGQVFGRLTVLEESAPPSEYLTYKGRWYRCRCQCGNTAVVRRSCLLGGDYQILRMFAAGDIAKQCDDENA